MFEVLIDKIIGAKKEISRYGIGTVVLQYHDHTYQQSAYDILSAVLLVPIDTHRLELSRSFNQPKCSWTLTKWPDDVIPSCVLRNLSQWTLALLEWHILMTSLRHESCETFHSGHMHCWMALWSQEWNTTPRIRNLPLINPYLKDGREALYNVAGTLHRDFQSGGTHKKWRVRLT